MEKRQDRSVLPDWPLLLTLAGVKFFMHLATNAWSQAIGYGFHRDEFYYVTGGWRAEFGYVDHPPLVPWLGALHERLFGDSVFLLRMWPALAAAVLVILVGVLAARLGGRRWAQGLAATAAIVCPINLLLFSLFQVNPFDQVLWTLGLVVLAGIVQHGADDSRAGRRWLCFGLVAGIGLLTKYTIVMFGAAVFLTLLISSSLRPHLKRPAAWLGGLAALLLAAPNLWWQWQHGMPFLEFAASKESVPPWESLALQVLFLGPFSIVLLVAGLRWLRSSACFRPLGWIFVLTLVGFLITMAKPYYGVPIYFVALAAGAVAWQDKREGSRWPFALLTLNLLLAPVMLPVLQPAVYASGYDSTPNDELGEMLGWPEFVDAVEQAAGEIPEEEFSSWVVLTRNYGEAASLEILGRGRRIPRVLSGHNSYYYWSEGESLAKVLLIGASREQAERGWESVREVGRVSNDWQIPNDEYGQSLFLVEGLRTTDADAWDQLRRFR